MRSSLRDALVSGPALNAPESPSQQFDEEPMPRQPSASKQSAKPKTARDLATQVVEQSALFNSEATPFKAFSFAGAPRVVVVAGDNCTGKSLFVEVLRGWARVHKAVDDTICVSIRERTGSGLSDMAGMRRMFMFGDESEQSTGAVSARVIQTAFTTLATRASEDVRSLLVLDEPELGMSEAYAGALGELIGGEAAKVASPSAGVAIVTHSKALVARLVEALGECPTFVHMGRSLSLQDWLTSKEHRSVADLLALSDLNHAGRKAVWAATDDR